MIFSETVWQYRNPVELICGPGVLDRLPAVAPAGKTLIVTSPGFTRRGLTKQVTELLHDRQCLILDSVSPNPTIDELEQAYSKLNEENIEVIVGIGGGSVLDSAKVLSYLLSLSDSDFSLRSYFENNEKLLQTLPLPLISVPTTSGTGSEVTPFATVWDMSSEKKYSLASPTLFSRTALLDPNLTVTLPGEITIMTGLDALSHALESIWNRNGSLITFNYAVRAVDLVLKHLPALVDNLQSIDLRSRLMEASLLAGLAISNSRTALAHSMSYPITARFGMPHGLACGFTLPAILEYNAGADDGRLLEVTRALGYSTVKELLENLITVFYHLDVDKLVKNYIRHPEELYALAPKMFTPGRVDNNMREICEENIRNMLKSCFHC